MFIDARGMVVNDNAYANFSTGQGVGVVGQMLSEVRFEPGLLRPYIDSKGRRCVTINTGRMLKGDKGDYFPERKQYLVDDLERAGVRSWAFNATTLTKDSWIQIDQQIEQVVRQELSAWNDLAGMGSVGGFDAMGKVTYEYSSISDPGEAVVDMDALTDARRDRPLQKLYSIPLPITHSDFDFSLREIMVSRNSGAPLDTVMAEAAGRRVAEMIERTVIGTETGLTFGTQATGPGAHTGTSTIYGYTNFPYRITKTDLTTPTGTNPEGVMTDLLEMTQTMRDNGYNGPYMVYMSTGYTRYLEDDYFRSGSTSAVRTLRERLMAIANIRDIRTLNYLTSGYQIIMIQMDRRIAQAINGMRPTTVMWESKGGLQQNFKVMAIQVPLLRTPYNGVAGIQHATTS